MIAPIVVPAHGVADRFDLARWQAELAGVGLGSAVQRNGLCAQSEAFACCGVARFWVVEPALQGYPRADSTFDTPVCPVCHPEHYVDELDKDGRIELARALAQTDAIVCMHALLDQALSEGRTHESQWHNPEDVAEIAALKSLLADRVPPANVYGWAGVPKAEQKDIDPRQISICDGRLFVVLPVDEAKALGLYERYVPTSIGYRCTSSIAATAFVPEPNPITGLRTPAFTPRIRPVAENAERVAAIHMGLRDAFPMLAIEQRNAAIIDALVERGEVTLTAGPGGRLEVS